MRPKEVSKGLLNRAVAVMLALIMTLSMSGFALEDAFAETGAANASETGFLAADNREENNSAGNEDAGDPDENTYIAADGDNPNNNAAAADTESANAEDADNDAADADAEDSDAGNIDNAAADTGEDGSAGNNGTAGDVDSDSDDNDQDAEDNTNITITVAQNLDGVIRLKWDPVTPARDANPYTGDSSTGDSVAGDSSTGDSVAASSTTGAFSTGKITYTINKQVCDAYKPSTVFDEGISSFNTTSTEYTFKGLYPGRRYTFTVTAKNDAGEVIAESREPVSEQPILSPVSRRARSSKTVSAKAIKINGSTDLRSKIGETYKGYSVVQGGCTDGTYAYYLMVSPYNQHGRVAKVKMSTNKIVKVSGVLDTWHGNGMTYDSRRNLLVVNARNEGNVKRKQELTCIDATTLKIVRQQNISYSYFSSDTTNFVQEDRKRGLANVAYVEKYDVYVALQRVQHELIVIDPDSFKAMGIIRTTINAKYPGTHQAMDIDEQYAYQLLSYYNSSQPYNLILTLDWNADQLLDKDGHRRRYVPETWACLNNRKPVAVYRLRTSHEAGNIYHVTDSAGRTHFYLSEYDNSPHYVKKYYKKAYKVKWKKVKKKVRVRVKWKKVKKKVKVNGKWKTKKVWKYKYKWKTKKVWKYKKKYKKVYYRKFDHYDRLAHVYDLGVI